MVNIKVLQPFRDINDFSVLYKAGETYEFDDARAEKIVKAKLGEKAENTVEKPAEKQVKTDKPTTKKK